MKTKRFSVIYEVTTTHEAIVEAKNKEEAVEKVVEVVGDPIVIESVYVLKLKKGK